MTMMPHDATLKLMTCRFSAQKVAIYDSKLALLPSILITLTLLRAVMLILSHKWLLFGLKIDLAVIVYDAAPCCIPQSLIRHKITNVEEKLISFKNRNKFSVKKKFLK